MFKKGARIKNIYTGEHKIIMCVEEVSSVPPPVVFITHDGTRYDGQSLLHWRLEQDDLWQIYDVADTDEQARQAFIARYGHEPLLVWRDGGCVHAGPITKAEHDGKMAGPGAV